MATFFAFTFGLLLVGASFVERIFQLERDGAVGRGLDQQQRRDAIAAIDAVVAVLVMASSFLADVVYALLDPQVRSAGKAVARAPRPLLRSGTRCDPLALRSYIVTIACDMPFPPVGFASREVRFRAGGGGIR